MAITTRNPGAEITRRLLLIAANVEVSDHDALNQASLVVKKSLVAAAQRDAGGRMRNVGRRGVKLNARYDIRERGNRLESVIRVVPPGPWSMLSYGTRPHEIRPRRRSGKKAVSFDGEAFRKVQHPGTSGKGTATRGFNASVREANAILTRRVRRAVVNGFFGRR